MRPTRPLFLAFLLAGTASTGEALAQAEPPAIDIEMVRPPFTPDGGLVVDSPRADRPGTWLLGAAFQYERAPLRLFEYGDLVGHVVAHRNVLTLGGYVAMPGRFSLGFAIPMGVNLGSEIPDVPELDGDGFGFGDASVTLRWGAGTWGPASLGLVATTLFPTGASRKYLGERGVRLRAGLGAHFDTPIVEVLGGLRFHARAPVVTAYDFVAGSELEMDVGLRRTLPDARIDVLAELLTRVGISLDSFGGRVSSEVLVGVRYRPASGLRLDLALGRGLTGGYGTSAFRVMVGLSYAHFPPPPPPPAEEDLTVLERLPEKEPEPAPEPVPTEPPLAQVIADRIQIRDPIQFELGTTRILVESDPTLKAIANLLERAGTIGHVVIEGHASVEGSFEYNYELSRARAEAIYERLVMLGVHPDRMSYRGMGEVEAAVEGDDEASLAANRRVVFHIVRIYRPGEKVPERDTTIVLPWSGEPHEVIDPDPPPQDLLQEEEP